MYTVRFKHGTETITWQLSDIWQFPLVLVAFTISFTASLNKFKNETDYYAFIYSPLSSITYCLHSVPSNHYSESYNAICDLHKWNKIICWVQTEQDYDEFQPYTVHCQVCDCFDTAHEQGIIQQQDYFCT